MAAFSLRLSEFLAQKERQRTIATFVAEARAACSDPKLRREALAPAEDPVQLGNERLRVAENRGRYAASSAGDGH